ncbi:hypothetical protein [Thalassobacillus hwangdonensis]|uniref:Uncharacterized protein n=1 Tax=Thalassobacillus hwangdonensis TaxID=546108 RepID=A0ABW3L103_9BACI
MKKRKLLIIAVPILLVFLYGFTYFPQKLISIDPSEVSKITVFDGNTGEKVEITDEADINHVILNLNEVTFRKGKPSFMYSGYSFDTTILNHEGKSLMELTINTSDTIRYKGFFYTAVENSIDYDYMESLVRK